LKNTKQNQSKPNDKKPSGDGKPKKPDFDFNDFKVAAAIFAALFATAMGLVDEKSGRENSWLARFSKATLGKLVVKLIESLSQTKTLLGEFPGPNYHIAVFFFFSSSQSLSESKCARKTKRPRS
jgi:hypothetical protein